MTCGIYMIQHRASGKAYIGRSVDIEERWHGHRHDAKSRRGNNPVHNAIRKYGADAFDWIVLMEASDIHLADLEHELILDRGTMKPNGYNIGGTHGGFPSDGLIEQMPEEDRLMWRETMRRVGRLGHEALKEKRTDLAFEAEFLAKKSAASRKREANIKAKRAVDPEYDAKIREMRSTATKAARENNVDGAWQKKSAVTFKQRMMDDPEFAARVSANRRRAATASHESRRSCPNT